MSAIAFPEGGDVFPGIADFTQRAAASEMSAMEGSGRSAYRYRSAGHSPVPIRNSVDDKATRYLSNGC